MIWRPALVYFWACVIGIHGLGAPQRERTMKQRLKDALFENYDPAIIPVLGREEAIVINVAFDLMLVLELSTKDQELTSSGWFTFQWIDQLLHWNPEDYDDLYELVLSQSDIWLPNVLVENQVDEFLSLGNDYVKILLKYDGTITWEPDVVQRTHCAVDITKYPFDVQMCEINIRAWNNHNLTVILHSLHNEVGLKYLLPNGEWDIIDSKAYPYTFAVGQPTDARAADGVSSVIYLYRKRFFYVLSTIIPMVLLSCLNALVFALPTACGERMSLAVSALLAFTFYLGIISEDIPKISEDISILTLYLTLLLGLSTASVICAGLIINIYFRDPETPVPRRLHKFVSRMCFEEYNTNDPGFWRYSGTGCWDYTRGILEYEDAINQLLKGEFGGNILAGSEQFRVDLSGNSLGTTSSTNLRMLRLENGYQEGTPTDAVGVRKTSLKMSDHWLQGEAPPTKRRKQSLHEVKEKMKKKKTMPIFALFGQEVERILKEKQQQQDDDFITWTHLAGAIDRCLFWIFLVLTGSVNVIMLNLLLQ